MAWLANIYTFYDNNTRFVAILTKFPQIITSFTNIR